MNLSYIFQDNITQFSIRLLMLHLISVFIFPINFNNFLIKCNNILNAVTYSFERKGSRKQLFTNQAWKMASIVNRLRV